MGLLDYLDPETMALVKSLNEVSPEQKRAAQNQAAMQAGFAMLANNRGMSKGQAFGNAMGNGGMAGMDAYNGTLANAQREQMGQLTQGLQLSKIAEEQKRKASNLQLVEKLAAAHPEYADLLRLDSGEAIKRIYPTPNKSADPYYQFLPTANGYAVGNARTGAIETPFNTVVRSSDDPALQGQIAGAKKSGADLAEAQASAQIGLPKAQGQALETTKLVDDLLAHPGFKTAVGASSKLDPRNYIPGTDAKDFNIRLDQLKGKQFLQAFETLKGGGQITEMEGRKATDAISRMNTASSEAEFSKAAKEFQDAVNSGYEKLQKQASGIPEQVRYPSSAGTKGGARVPDGKENRMAILTNELNTEQQSLAAARQSGDLKGISEATRNIQLLQKEMGGKASVAPQVQSVAAKVRRYNPQTGRIE